MADSEDPQHPFSHPGARTINARGKLISLETPIVMGILNITPDSFHSESRIASVNAAIDSAGEMLGAGAAILDIGGASSRPGAEVIPVREELDRLMPVLQALRNTFPDAVLSVDTWRAEVAREALAAGAHIINDITAGTVEEDILRIVAEAGAPYIAMHMRGTPGDMPKSPEYDDLPGEVLLFFADRIRAIKAAGIGDIMIDPGFGFGKTAAQNFILLRHLNVFRFLELPLLIGLSRKSMIWRTLNITPEEALNGTTAMHMVALQQGANILRVHDVKEATEVVTLHNRLAARD